jgi:hypothetical protein
MIRELIVVGVTVVATAAMLAVLDAEPRPDSQTCLGPEEREYLRVLTLKAIDHSYENQIERLFEVWMKDSHEQPRRAINGTQIAISAHTRAKNNANNWNPPTCPASQP